MLTFHDILTPYNHQRFFFPRFLFLFYLLRNGKLSELFLYSCCQTHHEEKYVSHKKNRARVRSHHPPAGQCALTPRLNTSPPTQSPQSCNASNPQRPNPPQPRSATTPPGTTRRRARKEKEKSTSDDVIRCRHPGPLASAVSDRTSPARLPGTCGRRAAAFAWSG